MWLSGMDDTAQTSTYCCGYVDKKKPLWKNGIAGIVSLACYIFVLSMVIADADDAGHRLDE